MSPRPIREGLALACAPTEREVADTVASITDRHARVSHTRLPARLPAHHSDAAPAAPLSTVGPWFDGVDEDGVEVPADDDLTTRAGVALALDDAEHCLAVGLPMLADAVRAQRPVAIADARADVMRQMTRVCAALGALGDLS